MIIWGGCTGTSSGQVTDTGGKYSLTADTWTGISTKSAPAPRCFHVGVWTGLEMVIWGGRLADGSLTNTGGRYNATKDTWLPMTYKDAPSPRLSPYVVFTGGKVIIWGGRTAQGNLRDGGCYDPIKDRWIPIPSQGAPPPLSMGTAVWTGRQGQMLIWGGTTDASMTNSPLAGTGMGGRYDLNLNLWASISGLNAPSPRLLHTAIWDGTHMLIWGGASSLNPDETCVALDTGASYLPAVDKWMPITHDGAPEPRCDHIAALAGLVMLIWGGQSSGHLLLTGGLYDPAKDAWKSTPTSNAPAARQFHTGVWNSRGEVFIWGGMGSAGPLNSGSRFSLF